MMTKVYFLIAVAFFFRVNVSGQEWLAKVMPVEVDLTETTRIVKAEPVEVREDKYLYRLKEGNLFIGVAIGRCVETTWGSWDLPKGTVVDVVFYPAKKKRPSNFNLSTEGMKEGVDSGQRTFVNDDVGLYFATQFGAVTRIHFYPASRFKRLRCK